LAGSWTASSVADNYARLAELSVGEARQDARRSAAQLPTDRQLTAPGSRSATTVEAVTTRGVGAYRRLIIVTRERLTADGRRTVRWRVTLARAVRTSTGWALDEWQPQP
jgi:hypothetical protein